MNQQQRHKARTWTACSAAVGPGPTANTRRRCLRLGDHGRVALGGDDAPRDTGTVPLERSNKTPARI